MTPDHTVQGSERPADTAPAPPFAGLAGEAPQPEGLRAEVCRLHRGPEPDGLPALLAAAEIPEALRPEAMARARRLAAAARAKAGRHPLEGLLREYALSSAEGVALMCLAEALLRIPDDATRDALIRDKTGPGDWARHLGHGRSLFVNAATWGLLVTGRLAATRSESGLAAALGRLIARGGEPVIRRAVDLAMRLMGEQFVMGRTIEEALSRADAREAAGFRHSYDMLGEGALTAADAARYLSAYEGAIHAIGLWAQGRGPVDGPGISIKLSALHPRYERAQRARVMAELRPRVVALARLAQSYQIGLNIDAEESERLDLSLDILDALSGDPGLSGWDGLGFVVQAYQKRAPAVIDVLADLAARDRRRIMVRLVKGAYWDGEIKRAQAAGLAGFPVFTRKVHTDVSYLACARRLLDARDRLFPQFATHNAATLSAVMALAGEPFRPGDYEFQCLHGMGEPLYEEVVGPDRLGRPCRVYAPVGAHETLLAYLVRRLIENGANSSFVHKAADPAVALDALLADPVAEARAVSPLGAPHPRIVLPRDLYGARRVNSSGLDLADDAALADLADALQAAAGPAVAAPLIDGPAHPAGPAEAIRNPADLREMAGEVHWASSADLDLALARAEVDGAGWTATAPAARAAILRRAADLYEARAPRLVALIVREAGRTVPNAAGEVREAVDFLRYYASGAEDFPDDRPRGPVAAISPWNFPLAIFTGQVAAALAAGNPVLAKPAEETPLVAATAVALLHEAGIPRAALQLLPGDSALGAALVADPRIRAVLFTGSLAAARAIDRSLAQRLGPDGRPVPLVAETGGLNAMVVDSSALPEQVVADVIASAFDSAGQRCSALRLLCLQEEVADTILAMLKGAMAELRLGDPARLDTDVGPLISDAARAAVGCHLADMAGRGHRITLMPVPEDCAHGTFLAPALVELDDPAALTREVFGPVLHVARYPRDGLDQLIATVNAAGYALTFGLHTRIDETIAHVTGRIAAGNIYVNRNMIGAVVGVQPFGGHGLSGTGPKAGGPLYLARLRARDDDTVPGLPEGRAAPEAALRWIAHLETLGMDREAGHARALLERSPLGGSAELPGPAGERNTYSLGPKGTVLCRPLTLPGFLAQVSAVLATGNRAAVMLPPALEAADFLMPEGLRGTAVRRSALATAAAAVLAEGEGEDLRILLGAIAAREGPVRPVHARTSAELAAGADYPLAFLVEERTVSVNTAAAGGNAALMALD